MLLVATFSFIYIRICWPTVKWHSMYIYTFNQSDQRKRKRYNKLVFFFTFGFGLGTTIEL